MITVGVDLAADARTTAVAVLKWSGGRADVVSLDCPATNELIVERSQDANKIGIDCPFGWPTPFVDLVVQHRDGIVEVATDTVAARSPLVYRATDLHCHQHGLRPLSVSADLIAHVAMRCAGLLPRLDVDADRSGRSRLVEAYPAASLKHWRLTHRRYKGRENVGVLGESVDALCAAAPWLRLGRHEITFRTNDNAFDAVIAGLTARAAALGRTEGPPASLVERARVEGWIALPTCELSELVE